VLAALADLDRSRAEVKAEIEPLRGDLTIRPT
jgi:hypothetical protein